MAGARLVPAILPASNCSLNAHVNVDTAVSALIYRSRSAAGALLTISRRPLYHRRRRSILCSCALVLQGSLRSIKLKPMRLHR